MSLLFWAISLCAHDRPPGPVVDTCDVIWVSHVYDLDGNLSFVQFVFLDYNRETNRFDVRAWRMAKTKDRPIYHAASGQWRLAFDDAGTLRQIRAGCAIERWDQWDPETEERLILPACDRRELSVPAGRASRFAPKVP